jgi:hypothetical protein
MRKFLHLLSQRRVGCKTDTWSPVRFASRDGNQDVLLRPSTLAIHLLELVEGNLELFGAMLKRSNRVCEPWIEAPTKSDKIVFVAAEGIVMRAERQAREKSLQLCWCDPGPRGLQAGGD